MVGACDGDCGGERKEVEHLPEKLHNLENIEVGVNDDDSKEEEGDEDFEPEDQGICDYLEGTGCGASIMYRRDASGEERARRNSTAKDVVIRVELRRDFE